jgi:hypothetical protein
MKQFNYKQNKYKYKFIKSIANENYENLNNYFFKYLSYTNKDYQEQLGGGGSNNLNLTKSNLKELLNNMYSSDLIKQIFKEKNYSINFNEFNKKIINSFSDDKILNIIGGVWSPNLTMLIVIGLTFMTSIDSYYINDTMK